MKPSMFYDIIGVLKKELEQSLNKRTSKAAF